jgi:transposase
MQDTQLYQQILGLVAPWRVAGVRMDRAAREIEVEVVCDETVWACPECGERAHVHDWERRRWRHLDSCQFKTLLVADVPRVQCPAHGSVTVKVPWAEPRSRFTAYFERLAIDVMQECSIKGACELLRISWDEADGIKQRAVARGLQRKPAVLMRRLGVDEKSFGRGMKFVTLVTQHRDAAKGSEATVEYVGDGRGRDALDGFWMGCSDAQRAAVESMSMDMWAPYLASTRDHLPGADGKIVHDPFHLVGHMTDAVDRIRRQEQRVLKAMGDDRLTGSRQMWLYGFERLPERWRGRMDELRGQKLKTSRAWAIKEMFRDLWACRSVPEARAFFAHWYGWAIRSGLGPVRKVAKMFKRHLPQILTYFVHHLTNALAEGLNNRIASLVKKAYGYRSRVRFKTDIFFHLGGLDLYPAMTQ